MCPRKFPRTDRAPRAPRTVFATTAAGAAATLALSGLGLGLAPPARAADAPQRIEVTGTRLPGVTTEGTGPAQVITRAQIERSGATSVADLLKALPAANANGADDSAVFGFAPGVGAVSLRGLGTQATLVLLDGRRLAPWGFVPDGQTSAVNLASLPIAALERVDVMLDGASAVYGSDAVGGVINLITRKTQPGIVARASLGQALPHGDATRRTASLSLGLPAGGGPGAGAVVTFEHADQAAVKASARPLTATGDFTRLTGNDWRSTYGYPGTLYTPGGADGGGDVLIGPLAPAACAAAPASAGLALAGACVYDPVRHQDLAPRMQRDTLFATGTWTLGGTHTVFASAMLSRLQFRQENPSFGTDLYYQFFGSTPGAAITLPVGHPQNPLSTPVALRTRWADRPLLAEVRSLDTRTVLGLRGDWAGWDGEVAAFAARSDARLQRSGMVRDSVVAGEVLDAANGSVARSGFLFGQPAANDPALMARLYPTLVSRGLASVDGVDVKASREFATLPGGPLTALWGAEWRRERFTSTPDPLQAAGEISVLGRYAADGERRVAAVFAEGSAPLAAGLDLRAAVRADRYDGFGVTASPRVGLRWQAAPTLAWRASVARGFRAPSIGELTQAPTLGFFGGVRDPVLCPDPSQTGNPACATVVLATLTRGADLRPERSTSTSVGLAFEPSRSTRLTLDIYRIQRRDEIASYDANYVLANESRLPGLVARDPGTGAITSLTLPLTNIGVTRLWGADLAAATRVGLGEAGSLGLDLQANVQPSVRVTPVPGAAAEQRAGAYQRPRQRASASATWERGATWVRATLHHVGGYGLAYGPSDAACAYAGTALAARCALPAWTTLDLGLGWRPTPALELSLSVRNATDRAPPVDVRYDALTYTLYNPAFHNALGRLVTLGVQARF